MKHEIRQLVRMLNNWSKEADDIGADDIVAELESAIEDLESAIEHYDKAIELELKKSWRIK